MKLLPLLVLLLLPDAALAARKKPAAPAPPAPPVVAPMTPAESELADVVLRASPGPAEYIFFLDTSGEMLSVAREARAAIAGIVEQIPDGDRVEVVAFHTRATIAVDSSVVDGTTRAGLVERIRSLELTSAKDSDLGAGLAYAASRLNQSDAPDLQFLFVVSTFCHDPSIASDYDSGGRGCRAIRSLSSITDGFRKTRGSRTLVTTLFPMETRTTPRSAEGLQVALDLFGGGTVVEPADKSFVRWAAEYRAHTRLERVLPLVKADVAGAGLQVRIIRPPTSKNPTAEIEIGGGTRYLPVHLSDVRAAGQITGGVPSELDLAPVTRLEVQVIPPRTPFAILPHEDTVDVPLTITGNATLRPEASLAELGLTALGDAQSATVTAAWKRSYGLPGWLVALALTGVAATSFGVTIILHRRMRVVVLEGSFTWRQTGGPRYPLEIRNVTEAYIGIDGRGELAVQREGAIIALRMVKKGLDAYAEVEIFADGVEINRRPARRGRHRVVAGATSFQFGEYRLTWE